MKRITYYLLPIALLLSACLSFGQQLPLNDQYLINKFSLSPAYAGANDNYETFMSFRRDWTGIQGAPETKGININGALAKNMGIGGTITNEQIGIFKNLSASLAYAYNLKLSSVQSLRIGLSGGFLDNHIDLLGNKTSNQLDPVVLNYQDQDATVFDASAGILYSYQKLNIGVAIPHLIENKIEEPRESLQAGGPISILYTLQRQYNIHASYSHNFNSNWQIEPYAVVRKTMNSPLFYEVASLIKYQQIWIGATYRKGNSFGASIGGVIYNKAVMNYTYEFSSNGMLANSSGTHEISIGFLLGKNKNNKSSIFNSNSSKQSYYQFIDK